jgi:hypothetical protein
VLLVLDLMMTFHVATIVRLTLLPSWQQRFAPLAAAGRMPLTNYLVQTALGLTIFYGWGIGLWGRTGVVQPMVAGALSGRAARTPLADCDLRARAVAGLAERFPRQRGEQCQYQDSALYCAFPFAALVLSSSVRSKSASSHAM